MEKKVEIISAETVDKVINSIKETKEEHPEFKDGNTDLEKVKEVLGSLKDCTAHTVMGVVTTALLLLPAGAIIACLDMGKQALRVRALSELVEMVGKCPACSNKEATETETPEAPTE